MMTRLGFLLAGVLAGILVVSPWEPGSAASTGPATIPDHDARIGASPGSTWARAASRPATWRSCGSGSSIARRELIGRAELVCTFVDSRRLRSCRGTYIMPKGRLVVGGELQFRQFYSLAVIGGTGLYDNARGTLTVTRMGTSPVRELVVFRLVG